MAVGGCGNSRPRDVVIQPAPTVTTGAAADASASVATDVPSAPVDAQIDTSATLGAAIDAPTDPPVDAPTDARAAKSSCPVRAPTAITACRSPGQRCAYATNPGCGSIWECYLGAWSSIADTGCNATSKRQCPKTLPTKAADIPAARGGPTLPEETLSCIYLGAQGAGAVVCGFAYPDRGCSGVARPMPSPEWRCEGAPPAGCSNPQAGLRCEPERLTCGTTCCGEQSVCTRGKWVTTMYPCPP